MWKSQGGILVNIVPREFRGHKPKGPRVFGLRTSRVLVGLESYESHEPHLSGYTFELHQESLSEPHTLSLHLTRG